MKRGKKLNVCRIVNKIMNNKGWNEAKMHGHTECQQSRVHTLHYYSYHDYHIIKEKELQNYWPLHSAETLLGAPIQLPFTANI